jgi:D-arabinose 1-dehydrogenase-like Zn-dependent alcohol dehydrogenase
VKRSCKSMSNYEVHCRLCRSGLLDCCEAKKVVGYNINGLYLCPSCYIAGVSTTPEMVYKYELLTVSTLVAVSACLAKEVCLSCPSYVKCLTLGVE